MPKPGNYLKSIVRNQYAVKIVTEYNILIVMWYSF
jgi:hypothetical protein